MFVLAGAFLPDPTGVNPTRRAVQLIARFTSDTFALSFINIQPKSRGTVKIQANDPLKMVLADEGLLSNPAEIAKQLLKEDGHSILY